MKHVKVGDLKARLSEFLREVRSGETVTVFDRNTAIAQIVPLSERAGVRIRKPRKGSPPPNQVPVPAASASNVDIVALLLEERQSHR